MCDLQYVDEGTINIEACIDILERRAYAASKAESENSVYNKAANAKRHCAHATIAYA